MLKTVLKKNYLIYGSSIVFSRGLEYFVLFFAAYYLSKEEYGALEFYKKVIEIGSSVLAFGFPALILSYTKSKSSKAHFYLLAILFVLAFGVVLGILFSFSSWLVLIIPFVFYALFFTGGITHSYLLVQKGSNYASYYKTAVSILFYTTVFVSIYTFNLSSKAFVYVNYVLFPLLVVYVFFQLKSQRFLFHQVKKYWKLFKSLLLSSFSLVVSNFANLMFLYTDIFVLKIFSKNANVDIANYSFSLNIAAMLLLIPMTLVQVDIEKLKSSRAYVSVLNKKIIALTFAATIFLILFFLLLTEFILFDYRGVFYLFLLIIAAKVVQAFSPLYGTMIVVEKRFNQNLFINIISLVLNVILSIPLYYTFGVYGVAAASLIMLTVRQYLLYRCYMKIFN